MLRAQQKKLTLGTRLVAPVVVFVAVSLLVVFVSATQWRWTCWNDDGGRGLCHGNLLLNENQLICNSILGVKRGGDNRLPRQKVD